MGILDENNPYHEEQAYFDNQDNNELSKYVIKPRIPESPSNDFFIYRIDGNDIIEEIVHQLRGEVISFNKEGEKTWEKKFDVLANEEGINKIVYILYSNGINKNTLLGQLTHEEIYSRCNRIWRKLSLLLFKNCDRYNIKDDMRCLIIQTIINNIHSGLSRSEGGKEADQLSTATQRHEIVNTKDDKKDSILDKIPFLGNK